MHTGRHIVPAALSLETISYIAARRQVLQLCPVRRRTRDAAREYIVRELDLPNQDNSIRELDVVRSVCVEGIINQAQLDSEKGHLLFFAVCQSESRCVRCLFFDYFTIDGGRDKRSKVGTSLCVSVVC